MHLTLVSEEGSSTQTTLFSQEKASVYNLVLEASPKGKMSKTGLFLNIKLGLPVPYSI